MKAILRGKYLQSGSYFSVKQNVAIPTVDILTGREVVQVTGCTASNFAEMDDVEIPVIVRRGKTGLWVEFDKEAVPDDKL